VSRSEVPPKKRPAPRLHLSSHLDNSSHPVFGVKTGWEDQLEVKRFGSLRCLPRTRPFCSSILT
jgi:hypothetical protein